MTRLQTREYPDPAQSVEGSSPTPAQGKIAAIMDKYRARIEDINSKTTDKNSPVPTMETKARDSAIINESRLRVQKANSVMDGIGRDVRKLEAYSKALMMVRRSLTSAVRNYSYLGREKQGGP